MFDKKEIYGINTKQQQQKLGNVGNSGILAL